MVVYGNAVMLGHDSAIEKELDAEDMREQGRLDKPFALDIDPEWLPDIDPEWLPDIHELKRRIAFHEGTLKIM